MILIADSGGTKTDWRLLHKDATISQFKSSGFNPYLHKKEVLEQILENEILPQISSPIQEVYFYGAGISSENNIHTTTQTIKSKIPGAAIQVSNDLLAAARALCLDQPGITCILGTGANSCLYDGKEIIQNAVSLGYILGDEGSGADLGKTFVAAWLREEAPEKIAARFNKRFELDRDIILSKVYQEPAPSAYLASFGKFIFQQLDDPWIYKMGYDRFNLFFEKNVMKYPEPEKHMIHFTGSIAFYFGNLIRQVAQDKGLRVGNILESPIAGLTLYHMPKTNSL